MKTYTYTLFDKIVTVITGLPLLGVLLVLKPYIVFKMTPPIAQKPKNKSGDTLGDDSGEISNCGTCKEKVCTMTVNGQKKRYITANGSDEIAVLCGTMAYAKNYRLQISML